MNTIDKINQYTEELKKVKTDDDFAYSNLSQYYGIYRVLSDLYNENDKCNDAIAEFFKVYKSKNEENNQFINQRLNDRLAKMQEDVKICERVSKMMEKDTTTSETPIEDETKEKVSTDDIKDGLVGILGSVSQLFSAKVLPFIDKTKARTDIPENIKVDTIKSYIEDILKVSDCSLDYFNKKMSYVKSANSIEDLIYTVKRSITNGANIK